MIDTRKMLSPGKAELSIVNGPLTVNGDPVVPSRVRHVLHNIPDDELISLVRSYKVAYTEVSDDDLVSQAQEIMYLLTMLDETLIEAREEGFDFDSLSAMGLFQDSLSLNGVHTTARVDDNNDYYVFAIVDTTIATDLPELLGNEHSSPARYRLFRWWVGQLSEIEEI